MHRYTYECACVRTGCARYTRVPARTQAHARVHLRPCSPPHTRTHSPSAPYPLALSIPPSATQTLACIPRWRIRTRASGGSSRPLSTRWLCRAKCKRAIHQRPRITPSTTTPIRPRFALVCVCVFARRLNAAVPVSRPQRYMEHPAARGPSSDYAILTYLWASSSARFDDGTIRVA